MTEDMRMWIKADLSKQLRFLTNLKNSEKSENQGSIFINKSKFLSKLIDRSPEGTEKARFTLNLPPFEYSKKKYEA